MLLMYYIVREQRNNIHLYPDKCGVSFSLTQQVLLF